MARDRLENKESQDVKLHLITRRSGDVRNYNLPTISEVAALIVGDFDQSLGNRDILIESNNGTLQRISELHPSYIALQYQILFPYGEDGYTEEIPLSVLSNNVARGRKKVSQREYFSYRFHERHSESRHILSSRRLFQQFVVDAYTMIESARLNYIRLNQSKLRSDMYQGLADAVARGDDDASTIGKRVILPSSFTGGARYMIQNYQDAMAICQWAGYPDLFITITCNPKWPELHRYTTDRCLNSEDRPDIVARIFKLKLEEMMKDIRHNKIFGNVAAAIYTIEFQKRGLPHAHILIFLRKEEKFPSPEFIDNVISAEIPDKFVDQLYFSMVSNFMMHGPCGINRPNSPCMQNGSCSKHFPKQYAELTTIDPVGYPKYRRRDNGRNVMKNGTMLDNRYVVPHNRYLLTKYGGHINVEWCNQSRAIKYLFKYINKGNDRVTAKFSQSIVDQKKGMPIDEVNMYYDCRYISPCEAAWRIFSFEINYRDPPVQRLSFHLENQQNVIFSEREKIKSIAKRKSVAQSMFLGWFEANKMYEHANELTYCEFPTKFVWNNKARIWTERQKGFSIGRVYYVPPGAGDNYYLRMLINVVRGAKCHADMRCINGVLYNTYRDACYSLGLLEDDKEYIDGIEEASRWGSASSVRKLFANLLVSRSMSRPSHVWESSWRFLSDDILYKRRRLLNNQDLLMNDSDIKNYTLAELEKILKHSGKSLIDFEGMPYPESGFLMNDGNVLLRAELSYDRMEMANQLDNYISQLNNEQKVVYDTIMKRATSGFGGVFFVYGYGGTGKTFIWKTLSAALRAKGEVVLNVASSGIASLLLPGGRTAHSRFAIPININEYSICVIDQRSDLAELIVKCKLIIWDEAPMMHKHCFEALDKAMRDILRFQDSCCSNTPFGGKTMVFGGDFRQILPIIPRGSRSDVVNATINSSYLWKHVEVLKLTKNMRLLNISDQDILNEMKEFSEWVADIGDGTMGGDNDGICTVDIPNDIVLDFQGDPIEAIVNSTYPISLIGSVDVSYLKDRAILAPTNDIVERVNEFMMSKNKEQSKVYLSSDTICNSESPADVLSEVHSTEFLNTLKSFGLPNHELKVKIGTPVMLVRNIDHSAGLCNGTRLVVTRLENHVIEAKVLAGRTAGDRVLIPRMTIIPSDHRIPFKFQRRQFPLMVSYAMTINKSQGQSLSHVGILLSKPVFSHGQLYVAVSRVTSRDGLKVLICDENNKSSSKTTNVVYKEVFQNL